MKPRATKQPFRTGDVVDWDKKVPFDQDETIIYNNLGQGPFVVETTASKAALDPMGNRIQRYYVTIEGYRQVWVPVEILYDVNKELDKLLKAKSEFLCTNTSCNRTVVLIDEGTGYVCSECYYDLRRVA